MTKARKLEQYRSTNEEPTENQPVRVLGLGSVPLWPVACRRSRRAVDDLVLGSATKTLAATISATRFLLITKQLEEKVAE